MSGQSVFVVFPDWGEIEGQRPPVAVCSSEFRAQAWIGAHVELFRNGPRPVIRRLLLDDMTPLKDLWSEAADA